MAVSALSAAVSWLFARHEALRTTLPADDTPWQRIAAPEAIALTAQRVADDAQLLAANGYVVVISNPRGSSGYGQDFSAALFGDVITVALRMRAGTALASVMALGLLASHTRC